MRHRLPPTCKDQVGFNPRICKRCDILNNRRFDLECVSIHASVKDATKANALATRAIMVSIHASVKDATEDRMFVDLNGCFNPRICKRCDSDIEHCYLLNSVSIHASVKDATMPMMFPIQTKMFQSTHL